MSFFDEPDEVLWELSDPNLDYDLIEESAYHSKSIGVYENAWGLPYDYSKKKYDGSDVVFDGPVSKIKQESDEKYPSKYTEDYWIRAYSQKQKTGTKFGGKWLLFTPKNHIDAAWAQVKDATERNLLGPESKVSTKLGEQGPDYVICVFTKNWKNEEDVMRVRQVLRDLGFERPIPYKTNEDTIARKYAKDGHKGLSKYFE
jgi:hypothetical protein